MHPPHGVPDTSCDLFYRGRFALIQPKGGGFRSGLDALLLAAALSPDLSGRAADLGAGAGAAGFAAACRAPGLEVTLVERDPDMAALARLSRDLAPNAHVRDRIGVTQADVLGGRAVREAAGLLDGSFAAVFTNPPFHPAGGRASPDPLRQAARAVQGPDFLLRWLRAAAALLRPGGLLAAVLRPDGLPAVLAAGENRFGDIRVLPVHPRPDRRASRILVQARRGSRGPLALLPGLVLHASEGALTPEGAAIGEGTATLLFEG